MKKWRMADRYINSPFSILNYLPAERTKRTGESIAAVAVILLRIIVLAALALLGLGIRVIALEVMRIGQRDGDIERLAGRNAVYAQRELVTGLLILLKFVYLMSGVGVPSTAGMTSPTCRPSLAAFARESMEYTCTPDTLPSADSTF